MKYLIMAAVLFLSGCETRHPSFACLKGELYEKEFQSDQFRQVDVVDGHKKFTVTACSES
jgi:hypothetical protein